MIISLKKAPNFLIFFSTFVYVARLPYFTFLILISVFLIFFIYIFSSRERSIHISFELLFLFLFLFCFLCRVIFSFIFSGNFESYYIFNIVVFSVYCFSLCLFNQESAVSISSGVFWAIIVTIIISIFESSTGIHMPTSRYSDANSVTFGWEYFRPTAFYYNENDMINALVCMVPFSFLYAKNELCRLSILLGLLVLSIYIASKAAMLTVLIYIMVSCFYLFSRGYISRIRTVMYFLSVCVSVFYFLNYIDRKYLNDAMSRMYDFMNSLNSSGYDGSTDERMEIYHASISYFSDSISRLLIGVGSFDGYNEYVKFFYNLRFGDFHNLLFEVITITGLMGLFILFSSYNVLFIKVLKMRCDFQYYIISLMLAYPLITSFGSSSVLRFPSLFMIIAFSSFFYMEISKANGDVNE